MMLPVALQLEPVVVTDMFSEQVWGVALNAVLAIARVRKKILIRFAVFIGTGFKQKIRRCDTVFSASILVSIQLCYNHH